MVNSQKNSMIKVNIFYNLIKTLSTIIFPLITFPYISRVLHAENVGKINFGNSIISYFSMLATLGVTTYAVRECSRVRNNKNLLEKTVSQILSINVCTMLFSYALMVACLMFVPKLISYRILIVVQSVSILFTVIGTDWLNTAMEDFRYITIRTFAFQLLSLIAMFCMVRKPEHYLRYAMICVFSSSGASLLNIVYRCRYCKVKLTKHMEWKKHFPPIILLFAMLLSQTVLNSLDATMLGFMKGDYEVGLYSTALKINNIISQVITSIAWVVMPQLSAEFGRGNYKKINELLHETASFTITLGVPCFVGVNVLASEIVEIIGGKEYLSATGCLHILSITMALNFLNGIFGNMILLPSMREKRYMGACILAAFVNGATNYMLIPKYGINGAAMATVISALVISLVVVTAKEKEIHFEGVLALFKAPIIGSLLIVILGVFVKSLISNIWIRTIVVVGTSVVFYFVTLILFRHEFTINILEPVIKKIRNSRREK